MNLQDFADKEPRFILEEFFSGSLRGYGMTIGRLGGFQNRFTIDARGRVDASANVLSLTEDYFFDDGHSDTLTWTILKRDKGRYEGSRNTDRRYGGGRTVRMCLPLAIQSRRAPGRWRQDKVRLRRLVHPA